jgi:hypothetical protein
VNHEPRINYLNYKKRQCKLPSKKEQGGKKSHMSKPEEQKGMPQHEHYPLTKRREDRNPKYHEEHRKDVA